MKYLYLILLGVVISSCQSQTRNNLLSLKFDEDLSGIIKNDKQLKKDQDPNLGLVSYTTDKLDNYALGAVKLATYSFPNGNIADYSNLSLFVADKSKNNYLGFKYNSVNQEETGAILSYLKKEYPKYEQSSTGGNGESFFWDVSAINAWIFVYQGISIDKGGKKFFSTNFILVKKGTRIENSDDAKVITIKDNYKMMYPDLIK